MLQQLLLDTCHHVPYAVVSHQSYLGHPDHLSVNGEVIDQCLMWLCGANTKFLAFAAPGVTSVMSQPSAVSREPFQRVKLIDTTTQHLPLVCIKEKGKSNFRAAQEHFAEHGVHLLTSKQSKDTFK